MRTRRNILFAAAGAALLSGEALAHHTKKHTRKQRQARRRRERRRNSGGSEVQSNSLLFPQPTLRNPLLITLNSTGQQTLNIPSNRDALISIPEGGRTGSTIINGGNQVVLKNGTIRPQPDLLIWTQDSQTSDADYRLLRVNGARHFFLANVLFENPTNREVDILGGGGANTIYTVQNIRVENHRGRNPGHHSDVIQPYNGLYLLRVDRMTVETNFQVLYMAPPSYVISQPVFLNRININHFEPNASSPFWIGNKSISWGGGGVYVQTDRAIEGDGNPGNWIAGTPPGGDFVPAGSVG